MCWHHLRRFPAAAAMLTHACYDPPSGLGKPNFVTSVKQIQAEDDRLISPYSLKGHF